MTFVWASWQEAVERGLHEKTDTHEWTKSFRPWNEKPKDKRHKCTTFCDHHVYYIECPCGASRKATADEFAAAQEKYEGY